MNVSPPKALYKYMKYQYALQMLIEGTISIGTLEYYRKADIHGLEIGDIEEGTQITQMSGKPMNPNKAETIPPTIQRLVKSGRLKFDPSIKEFTIFGDVKETL